MVENQNILVNVKKVKKYFKINRRIILKAVDDVSFHIHQGETFGLIGESGCGKTTLGRVLVRMQKVTEGTVTFGGLHLFAKQPRKIRRQFHQNIQMIFQDPYSSLNPRMTVKDIIAEGMDIHRLAGSTEERTWRVHELLEGVGLPRAYERLYPHELSGGQRQRVGIARALAVDPAFVVCDEPTSALDVSVRAQIVELLQKFQKERSLTYLLIAHDLSFIRYMCDRVGVMYLGGLVEMAAPESLFGEPLHPYTKVLVSSIPIPDPRVNRSRERLIIQGDPPSPLDPPSGCRFRTRCPQATEICEKNPPKWKEVSDRHWVACHLYNESLGKPI